MRKAKTAEQGDKDWDTYPNLGSLKTNPAP